MVRIKMDSRLTQIKCLPLGHYRPNFTRYKCNICNKIFHFPETCHHTDTGIYDLK